jgi:hypothetical protein
MEPEEYFLNGFRFESLNNFELKLKNKDSNPISASINYFEEF